MSPELMWKIFGAANLRGFPSWTGAAPKNVIEFEPDRSGPFAIRIGSQTASAFVPHETKENSGDAADTEAQREDADRRDKVHEAPPSFETRLGGCESTPELPREMFPCHSANLWTCRALTVPPPGLRPLSRRLSLSYLRTLCRTFVESAHDRLIFLSSKDGIPDARPCSVISKN